MSSSKPLVKKIMLIAGEASGDQRGAEVARALLTQDPQLSLFGIGGQDMRAAGVKTINDVTELAVMGFIEPIKHLPRIMKIFRKMQDILREEQPDLLILIDYPGFNLRLAKYAKQLGIKVLFYISPQVWAWRQNRVKKIAQVVDHMAVIFPFEAEFYQQHNVPVTYVGHPLTEKIKQQLDTQTARQKLALELQKTTITLLPGSRYSEVEKLLPIMLTAAQQLLQHHPALQFVLALASTIAVEKIQALLDKYAVPVVISTDSFTALCAADVVITASGTATLETALLKKPMVVCYKVNALSAAIARRVIKIPWISLCNIVANKMVVKELLQNDATAENISQEVLHILNDVAYRTTMINNLQQIAEKLGTAPAAQNVASIALQMLHA